MNNQYDNQNNAWMARYNAHIIFCKAETFPQTLLRDSFMEVDDE